MYKKFSEILTITVTLIIIYIWIRIYNRYNSIVHKNNNQDTKIFLSKIYKKEEKKLEKAKEKTIECMKIYKSPEKRRSECSKFKLSLPSYEKIPYKEIYRKYNGGYKAILQPSYQNNIDIIVGIPFAPPLIDGRIVARRTYMKIKEIDGYKVMYVLFSGLIPERIYSYNFSLLKEEAEIFNDILIFDMINTYWNITLLLMSMHKWIIEKYSKIKYFIRCNLDAVFIPSRIKGLLHNNYDIISQIGRHVKMKINYPQGFFYIFSFRIVKHIYEMSLKRRIHRWDDIFYGQIIKSDNSIKIFDLKSQSEFFCTFCPMLYSKSFISLHGYTFSPAMIELIYFYSLNDVNKNIFK